MLVQEENDKINGVINRIFNYLNSNLNIKNDLNEYYKAIGINEKNAQLRNTYILNYIFERRLGENRKSIFDFALNDISDLSTEEREIINMLKNSIDGIFEVRKITHNQFELFNILNEKLYIVHPLTKMNKFSNLSVGHFVMARLIMLNGEYYIYHVIDHITYSNRITAFQIAISRLAQNPALLHHDHPEKLEELKQSSENMYKKFQELFKSEMIITSNKNADELISALNEFMETETLPDEDLTSYISPIENSEYFDISELQSGGNVLAEAKKGFSSQNHEYNVALVANEKLGLQVIPFMDIFLDIFEKEDYKSIKNYKECITKFVQEKQISQLPLEIANEKYPEKFMQRINEIMETNFAKIDDIENKYKKMYIENPYTSSTLVLYSSYAFKRLIDVIDTEKNENMPKQKIGRNDPCPCGSGLKYKKCCGKMVQI